jgi:ketosteroid isomerase-like protein
MDEQTIRSHAERFIGALHALEQAAGDGNAEAEALAEQFAEEAHLTNAAMRLTGEEKQGKEAVRAFWKNYKKTLGVARSDFHHITVGGEGAAGLFWRTEGTNADGQNGAAHYDGATLLVFDAQGKIRQFQGYYDTRQLDREVGTALP